ncbi:glycosyltransferase family 92 protein, partial [bacterium]|nr:glycosyltransferase family 92 protein [bacterium]
MKRPLEECINRFRSYEVLDLQIKLIRKFMPFVDKVFVVVSSDSQVPENVKVLENVHIVKHKEIIPKMFLPCFNSCTIEMFIHNIKDLSEKFIYFNDDCFPLNLMKEEDFFIDGKIRMNYELNTYDEETATIFQHNIINSTNLFYKKHEILYNGIKPDHMPLPLFKSSCKEVFNTNSEKIYSSLTRTRHSKNMNAYIYFIYLFKSCKRKKSYIKNEYFEYVDNFETLYKSIKNGVQLICINNNSYIYDIDNWKIELRKFLECLLNDTEYVAPVKEEPKITLDNTLLNVALCAIAKNENLYIREWVEWYKNLGISKIFLYDNNELDGERFEEVINDYIENGFVEISNWRGMIKSVKSDKDGQTIQGLAYHDCYYNHYKEFDWMCFFDIDEYLEIYNTYKNIYEFLNDFNEYDGIRVQWKMYGDNEQLHYENKSLFERFKVESNASYDKHVKQILNCNKEFDEELLFCAHGVFNKKYKFVNVLKNKLRNVYMDVVTYDNLPVYLNHFYSKSTEEFLKRKYNKTSAVSGINNTRNFNIDFLKKQYFDHNKLTKEKENMFNLYNEYVEAKNYDHIIV